MSEGSWYSRALPAPLPEGERMLWQGSPDWRVLARTALHTRLVGAWFIILAVAALALGQGVRATLLTLLAGGLAVGLLTLLARAMAHGTTYTLTDRRLVMAWGVALNKAVNLPLAQIASADMARVGDGVADIVLKTSSPFPLAWLSVWPNVRPWKVGKVEPMLRAVPESLGATLAAALTAADPSSHGKVVAMPARAVHIPAEAVAA